MSEYHIEGGYPLSGEVRVSGGKNAILPILAATILSGSESVLHNCPVISDTMISLDILKELGANCSMDGNDVVISSEGVNNCVVPTNLAKEMRSSIIFMGSLIARCGYVKISYPGGCMLGERPIDLHLKGLRALGVIIEEVTEDGNEVLIAKADKLKGAIIDLALPSVGATENIMLAATLAEGKTEILNAAKEPEIYDLAVFLNSMGASIHGAGTERIVIHGVHKLHSAEHTVMPDRIVAGTFMVAAAMTGGDVIIRKVVPEHIYPVTTKLFETGCMISSHQDSIRIKAPPKLLAMKRFKTEAYPGFPTDMQPQFIALLSLADGLSVIDETIFDSRNRHIAELVRLGANIGVSKDNRTFIIQGVNKLRGAVVDAKDLRGGAALIIAGLAAEGMTVVLNSKYVERGYESIDTSFNSLGAKVTFVKDN